MENLQAFLRLKVVYTWNQFWNYGHTFQQCLLSDAKVLQKGSEKVSPLGMLIAPMPKLQPLCFVWKGVWGKVWLPRCCRQQREKIPGEWHQSTPLGNCCGFRQKQTISKGLWREGKTKESTEICHCRKAMHPMQGKLLWWEVWLPEIPALTGI